MESFPYEKQEKDKARIIELAREIEKEIKGLDKLTDDFELLEEKDPDFFKEEKERFLKTNKGWEQLISKYQKGDYDEETLEKLRAIKEELKKILEESFNKFNKYQERKKQREEPLKIKPKEIKLSYPYDEIDRLGKILVGFKKKARETTDSELKNFYEKQVIIYQQEMEKAKKVRDKIKEERKKRKGIGKIETKHKEKPPKESEEELDKKAEAEAEAYAEEWREEIEKEKDALGEIHDVAEPTPTPEGEEMPEEELKEKGIEIEQLLAAADTQSEKINSEIEKKNSWIRERIEKTASWYKKQPLWKKLLFSAGCIGAASASAALGGAVGGAIATSAFAGTLGQRMLGGLATFVTVEGLLKKSAEKGDRERGKWEARRHTAEAAILGILVGSGQFAQGIKNIAEATGVSDFLHETYRHWFPKEELAKIAPETPPVETPKIPKPSILEIGKKGPEGSIIDYFKSDPEAAKNFGWDGKTDLSKWAGIKAHQLWLEDAQEALTKPETLEQLKELGYSQDIEGYAQMMSNIGKGAVEINPQTGEIKLRDIEYLKARVVPEAPETKTTGNKIFDIFDKQTRPEKWRMIQFYQNDIDAMKENLIKIQDSDVALSVQNEINRLEGIKQSLIARLAEQTEQVASAPKAAEAVAHILSAEKQNFLDKLIYEDTHLPSFKVYTLIDQIKAGKLTVEDFSKYYASKIGAERVSDEMLNNLKNNFKAISEGGVRERIKASRAIAVIIQKLEKIK